MATQRQARRIPIKIVPFELSDHSLIFLKKRFYLLVLGVLPVAYFFPNISFILVMVLFAFFWGVVEVYCPRPFFESFKLKNKKDDLPYIYLGDDEFGFPVEIPATALKQHMLLVGSTGSGKTSFLRRMMWYHLKAGGGICFIDGKADVADMYQIFYSVVAEADRVEDLYVINFLNPEESHSINPLMTGDSDFLSDVLESMLEKASGDQVYWQMRAIELMRALMAVLVWLRDNRGLRLTFGVIKNHMTLEKMAELARDESIPMTDEKGKPVRARLISYLEGLTPNWRYVGTSEQGNYEDISEAIRQFGYGVQQWGPTLDRFYGTYYKIFETTEPDVEIKDLVLNGKILYVLLPALKQSPQTLASLGRLLVALFKLAFMEFLGERVVGEAEALYYETQAKKPDPPFWMILDEAGSYLPEDLDTVLAQARSTGVATIISVQEIASIFKINEANAKRILNNTKIKISLAVDDPDTAKYYIERAGKEWTITPSVRKDFGEFFDRVGNLDGAMHYDLKERIMEIDLYSLKPGEGYIVYLDEVRKFKTPYLSPKRPKVMELLKAISVMNREFYKKLVSIYSPVVLMEERINEWDEEELGVLMEYDKNFTFSKYYQEKMASVLKDNLKLRDFIMEIMGEMYSDSEFLKFASPDQKVWEEAKVILFDITR